MAFAGLSVRNRITGSGRAAGASADFGGARQDGPESRLR
jgi:hypothetical protein